jgi:hypothetical protein
LETMSKRAKEVFGDSLLRVEKVERVQAQGNGEWKLTHNDPGTYTAGEEYWECTDGREILFRRPYIEDGVEIEAFYRVSDEYGEIGREYKTMEEAQAAVRPIYTPQEIVAVADELASAVWKYDPEEDDKDEIQMELAREYLSARRIKLEYKNEDDEETRAHSEYIVTMRVKGSKLPAVEKKAKVAWGDKVKISHVRRSSSNADLLGDAQEHVEQAVEIIAELQEDMESRRDNTPENFQGTETYSAVEEAADALESLKDEVEGVISSFDNIEFPGW